MSIAYISKDGLDLFFSFLSFLAQEVSEQKGSEVRDHGMCAETVVQEEERGDTTLK